MKRIILSSLAGGLFSLLLAGNLPVRGILPREQPAKYAQSRTLEQFGAGVSLLVNEVLRRTIATKTGKEYLVLEIAIYPAAGRTVTIKHQDFKLVAGAAKTGPATPEQVARDLYDKAATARSVSVHPTFEVGYETGSVPDPGTVPGTNPGQVGPDGTRGQRGLYTRTRVHVQLDQGNGRGASAKEREFMEEELTLRSLPEGPATSPVAGLLYFRLPPKVKLADCKLELTVNGAAVPFEIKPDRP